MFKILIISLIATLTVISNAQAGFMVEPYLGLERGSYDYGNSDGDLSGTNIGARLGYEMLGLTFGADYMMTKGDADPDNGGSNDFDGTDFGIFVGYQFPVLIQAYLSYFLSSEADIDSYSGKLKGDGYRIGAGYTGFPFIVINLEYITRTYDKAGSNTLSNKFETTGYALNVSLPLP